MKKLIFLISLFVLGLPVSAFAWEATVSFVNDADTFIVKDAEGKKQKIRLYGVDAPELEQPLGDVAYEYLNSILLNQAVRIESLYYDPYKRIVARVWLNDAEISELLVKQGYAWVFKHFCVADMCSDWEQLQNEAKQEQLGVWQDAKSIPPWKWRKQQGK